MARISRALISVSDKTGVVEFATALRDLGVEILSTGGTARTLAEAGVPVTPVEQVTGFPEMMEGRVKTLHPAVHGGILADRAKPEHLEQIAAHGIQPIDLVAVNLYPFAATVQRPDTTFAEAIENIDIGGPSMIRSAAKNHSGVAVVTLPADYETVIAELRASDGQLSDATRRRLAQQAFAHTAAYDATIAAYLAERVEDAPAHPETLVVGWEKAQDLRYGENPHQPAAFYRDPVQTEPGLATARQYSGEGLSFTNILDLNAALELVKEFDRPAVAIIKHTNPCGCGAAETLADAYRLARDGELPPFNPPGSRFGGIIALNRVVDVETANEIIAPQSKYDAIIAPDFEPEALRLIQERKIWGHTVRLLATGTLPTPDEILRDAAGLNRLDLKRVVGGLLVQARDLAAWPPPDLRVATQRQPTDAEWEDLRFAWKLVKHVKSNAIVLAKGGQLIGAGAGQMNRAKSSELAVEMAGHRAAGAVCASDAFFPFPDGPETLAKAGVTAIIQPGGSKKDEDTVAVCDQYGVAMVFAGMRHFRH